MDELCNWFGTAADCGLLIFARKIYCYDGRRAARDSFPTQRKNVFRFVAFRRQCTRKHTRNEKHIEITFPIPNGACIHLCSCEVGEPTSEQKKNRQTATLRHPTLGCWLRLHIPVRLSARTFPFAVHHFQIGSACIHLDASAECESCRAHSACMFLHHKEARVSCVGPT